MKFLIFIIVCMLFCLEEASAVSINAQKKYPNVLLSNDYGILSENDLGDFSWGFPENKQSPFNPKEVGGNYWHCFPRESIQITLKDTGFSTDEMGWKDTMADLEIKVWISPTLVHVYGIRKRFSVVDFEKRFDKWQRIMRGAKYVCLAGEFVNYEHKNENGMERDVYGWIFEKIKTKMGCDSYFYSCNPTYEAYLKRKAEEASYKFPSI
jgi:hypothetical protein